MEVATTKAGRTLARNKWRATRRQLLCFDRTGSQAVAAHTQGGMGTDLFISSMQNIPRLAIF